MMKLGSINSKRILWVTAPMVLVASSVLLFSAISQVDSFSKSEVQQIKQLPHSAKIGKACLGFEATFSAPLQEKPKAILDIEKLNLIQGALSKILDVVTISPNKYELRVTDPQACEALKGRQAVSVTVTDGKGADGRPIFPVERNFHTQK